MSGTRVTIELPDDLHERLSEASRREGSSLDMTILRLIERALVAPRESEASEVSGGRLLDPHLAAERRRTRSRLQPPLSRTVVDGRDDRV